MRIDSYDPFTQTLSALALTGRGDWIMTAGFAVSAGCLIVTAAGLRVLPGLPRIALAIAGCCGLATAALPDRLGTATAHIAATGLGVILLAIWPVLTVSPDPTMPWPRRRRWAISVSALLFGLVVWLCCDAWSGIDVGLSERAAATAEMLWPLVVVVSVRHLTELGTATQAGGVFQQIGSGGDAFGGCGHLGGDLAGPPDAVRSEDGPQICDQQLLGGLEEGARGPDI